MRTLVAILASLALGSACAPPSLEQRERDLVAACGAKYADFTEIASRVADLDSQAIACMQASQAYYEALEHVHCADLDEDHDVVLDRAFGGDEAAIRCVIARSDRSDLFMPYTAMEPLNSAVWRYLLWIATDEFPDEIFEIASMTERSALAGRLMTRYWEYTQHTGQSPAELVREDGCLVRPERMDQVWRAAQPDEASQACDDAVRPFRNH